MKEAKFEEHHEEQSRTWSWPRAIVRLVEKRIINEPEFFLLGKINSLCKNKEYGCVCDATNKYLGNWWGRSPGWVSEVVKKFKDLGLIKVRYIEKDGLTRRQIRVTFNGDEVVEKILKNTPTRKTVGGAIKTIAPPTRKTVASTVFHTVEKNNIAERRVRGANGGGSEPYGFGLNGDSHRVSKEANKLIESFHQFLHKHGLHLKRKDLANGPNQVGTSPESIQKRKRTLFKWAKDFDDLLLQYKRDGGFEKIEEVMFWYFRNFRNPWVPYVKAGSTFCEKFEEIIRAKQRINNEPIETRHVIDESTEEDLIPERVTAENYEEYYNSMPV